MKKIITYGTFDLFHRGHRSIIERAKALGDYLIVAVTGENYDMERGKLNVHDSLPTRIENVRKTGLADEIIVEEYLGQKISDITKYGVDVLAVGSDWIGKFDYLKKYCDVVYLERTKDISSTKLREQSGGIYKIGIITDGETDRDIVAESRFVSGLEVSGVYAADGDMAAEFRAKYDIGEVFASPELLFEVSDIVYVHTARASRYDLARRALERKKHVIMDFPAANRAELDRLYALAAQNDVALYGRLPLAFLRTFRQLLWLLHGGTIGDVLSVTCSMPMDGDAADAAIVPIFAFAKILGTNAESVRHFSTGAAYDRVTVEYPGAYASAEISASEWLRDGMTILGTRGRIEVPGKWWNMAYFRMDIVGEEATKRYSFNTEGPGFRYLLHDMLLTVESDHGAASGGITRDESLKLVEILERGGLL
ncbi:MAG: adenylyltransferase/cytidyltransferase family protein [Clostridiales Family XIII bacterium]|jgi:glycerol-3-phosphate cytidylyltransferase|nr:adenylyltransferase/cytidyltransferase family protein [Clostridiales Family XIII bacterium]